LTIDEKDIQIKDSIDRIYTANPELGHRKVAIYLEKDYGIALDRRTVLKHMQEMGIQAIYPHKNASKSVPGNIVYPYLLKDMEIERPNHVWSIDITYIPIKKSWLYLVAIIDWYSRYVISHEIDDTLEIRFVLEACRNALKNNSPQIMNSDQGSHFTSEKYTELFINADSLISMDHRGRAFDNIFIERFWRSLKYENVYLKCYETPRDARIGIRDYIDWYNQGRIHQNLDYRTPAQVYFAT